MDNNLLTYVLTTAKLDATGHRWVASLSNYIFSIIYKPAKGHKDADTLSHIKCPEAVELNSETVHAVCEGVHTPHGKVETLCHGAQVVDALSKDNAPPGNGTLRVVSYTNYGPYNQQNYSRNKTKDHREIEN